MGTLWQEIRRDFPITQHSIYLDHAAGGPIPAPVLGVIQRFQKENAEGADFYWLDWMKQRDQARQTVADFIHADPEEIAFVTSTSHGMNLAAEILAPQGKVLLNESEFPSSTVPWIWRKAAVDWSGNYLHLGDAKTLVTSFVQYATGEKQDIAAIGKIKADRFLVVNATQGFGVLPIHARDWNADFICTNSYKWMMAGYGGGILYIRKALLEKFPPRGAGWRSMVGCDLMQNKNLEMKKAGERYEWGCPNFASMFGFAAALKYFSQIGMDKIEKRILRLTDYLIARLQQEGRALFSPLQFEKRSGIVVFGVSQPVRIWKILLEKKIYVSPRGGGLRVAPHFYNTEEEIDRFLDALAEAERSLS
jgi:selenocysteine lyase/cysteine desulfurase